MGNIVKGIFGGTPKPDVSKAKRVVEDEEKKNRAARATLFFTEGGARGAKLNQSGNSRDTLLGN